MDFSQLENTDLAKIFNQLYQQNKMAEALNNIYTSKNQQEKNTPVNMNTVLPKSLYDSAISNLQNTNARAQEHGFGLFTKSLEDRDTMQKRTDYTKNMFTDMLSSTYANVVSSMESAMGRKLRGGEALVAMKYAANMLGNYLGLQDKNNNTLGNFLQQQEDTDTNLFDKLSKSSYFGTLINNAKGLLDTFNLGKQLDLYNKYQNINSLLNFFKETKPTISAENPIGPAEQALNNSKNPIYKGLLEALNVPESTSNRTNFPTDLTKEVPERSINNTVSQNVTNSISPQKNKKSFADMFNSYYNSLLP